MFSVEVRQAKILDLIVEFGKVVGDLVRKKQEENLSVIES